MHFLFDLVRLANTCYDAAEAKREVIEMTTEDRASHASAKKCGYCGRAFSKSLRKVRDQDHFTGRYTTATTWSSRRCRRMATMRWPKASTLARTIWPR